MSDQEDRALLIKQIENHICEIRRLAAQLNLPIDEQLKFERACGALTVDWKHHNQAMPSEGQVTVATVEPDELARRAAADRQQMLNTDAELRRRNAAMAAGNSGAGRSVGGVYV